MAKLSGAHKKCYVSDPVAPDELRQLENTFDGRIGDKSLGFRDVKPNDDGRLIFNQMS